jgi:hypothetical protein
VTEAVLDALPLPLCDPVFVLVPEALADAEPVPEGVKVLDCDPLPLPLPVGVADVVPVAVCVAV